MQTIFYPGHQGEPCRAEYGIIVSRDRDTARADIVVVNSRRVGWDIPLWNSARARDSVLNQILRNDLLGIRVDLVRFFSVLDADASTGRKGIELPIRLDFADYKKQGGGYRMERITAPTFVGRVLNMLGLSATKVWTLNTDVVGGCARFHADFANRRELLPQEIDELCESVGYQLQIGRPKLSVVK
jgi:hypothetical protein